MKTIVYSCGKSTTVAELATMVSTVDHPIVDVWFPEIYRQGLSGIFPYTEHEQVEVALQKCIGKTIVTTSQIIILTFLREIRLGRLPVEEFELWCGDSRIEISSDGHLLDWWDGGFFETGHNLRFDNE
ncbi:MAG: hypothetical protein ACYS7Y_04335 [Planctomycetota bacterium]|jgi:hypothetical protein